MNLAEQSGALEAVRTSRIGGWITQTLSELSDGAIALGLLLFGFAVRIAHIGEVWYWVEDSVIHAPSASVYTRTGLLGPDDWWTQPFKHVLLYADILVFGNSPVGWRMRNVLFGAGIVLVTYLLCRASFKRHFPAIAAALIVALDPLSIAWSRNTSEDTPATFFILLACLFFVKAMRSEKTADWLIAGLALGVAGSLRWYAAIPALLMLCLGVGLRWRRGGADEIARIVGFMGVLPFAVYFATFLPWASRGYSLGEVVALNVDAFRVQAAGLQGVHANLQIIAGPARWFTAWVGATVASYRHGAVTAMLNDPPVWFLFVPAVAYLLYRGIKGRNLSALLVGGSFVLMYAFFLSAQRPILLYSAVSIVPLGAIALGFSADALLRDRAWTLLGAVVFWCAYLYPLATGIPVPAWQYGWLITRLAGG